MADRPSAASRISSDVSRIYRNLAPSRYDPGVDRRAKRAQRIRVVALRNDVVRRRAAARADARGCRRRLRVAPTRSVLAPSAPSRFAPTRPSVASASTTFPRGERLDESASTAFLIENLRSFDDRTREKAIILLGDRGPSEKEAIPLLRAMVEDPNRRIRIRAEWALERIDSQTTGSPETSGRDDAPDDLRRRRLGRQLGQFLAVCASFAVRPPSPFASFAVRQFRRSPVFAVWPFRSLPRYPKADRPSRIRRRRIRSHSRRPQHHSISP